MRRAILISLLSLSITGCKRSEPRPAASTPASTATVAAPRLVPLTTASAEARALYVQAEQLGLAFNGDEAHALYLRAVAADPDFAQAHVRLAMDAAGDERTRHLERAAALAATLPEVERLWIEALGAHAANAPDEDQLARVAALAPDDWRVQIRIGDRTHGEGDYAASQAAYRRAIELAPTQAYPHNGLAYVLAAQGDLEGAAAAISRYAALSPGQPNPLDSKGEILLMGGKLDAAEQAFRAALAIDPGFRADDGIAAVQLHRGDLAGGIATLERALARTENAHLTWEVAQSLFWAYAAADRDVDARALGATLETLATAMGAPFPAVHRAASLARLELERSRWPEAIAILEPALATVAAAPASPASARLGRSLGVLRLRAALGAGDVTTAEALGKTVVAADPTDELAQLATLILAHHRRDLPAVRAALVALERRTARASEARLLAAETLAAAGQGDEAAALRQQVTRDFRRDPRSVILRRRAAQALERAAAPPIP